ncbi:MAG: glutamate--cysteine ligase, partial [Paraperlucidibaca sp.]|nr:glutamate--cysteine ligase [Paraperlucidibaca sp.]MBQ0842617.1 glutamate--cysteine ligase [Paraperlucidibaca sp.]
MDRELSIQLQWLSKQASCLQGMKRGLEKESLRIDSDGWLAQTPHPAALGSALTHPSITTDYSEALLELITPPCDSIASAFGYLDEVHRYVYSQLGSERLWVNSMPCKLGPDAQIPLAQYGSSNIGRMKTLYRHGLGLRYGRRMQTIAGIHYNLSFPDSFWQAWQEASGNTQSLTDFRSEKSFALIRNFQRRSWLLLYLLGASPAVCGSFLAGREHGLDAMPSGTLYRPNATSLRMSSLGYQNDAQSDLKVSYNALDEYVRDLDRAIRTPYAPYEAMGVKQNGIYQQLNGHILQLENEYYGLIRP